MKVNVCICLMCIILCGIYTSISAQESMIVYTGTEKLLDLSAFAQKCEELALDHPNVTRHRSRPCKAKISFDTPGKIVIDIRKENAIVKSLKYEVEKMPELTLRYRNLQDGEIDRKDFLEQEGPFLFSFETTFLKKISLSSFKIEHFRGKDLLFKRLNNGARYNTEIANLLKRVQANDRIRISDIEISIPGLENVEIKDLEFRIEE